MADDDEGKTTTLIKSAASAKKKKQLTGIELSLLGLKNLQPKQGYVTNNLGPPMKPKLMKKTKEDLEDDASRPKDWNQSSYIKRYNKCMGAAPLPEVPAGTEKAIPSDRNYYYNNVRRQNTDPRTGMTEMAMLMGGQPCHAAGGEKRIERRHLRPDGCRDEVWPQRIGKGNVGPNAHRQRWARSTGMA